MAATSPDRHVVEAAIALASFVRDTLIDDAERPGYAAFVRQTFGPRARVLGFAPKPDEGDDAALLRRALIGFVAPEDPPLSAEARRLALAWLADRSAVDAGMVDGVLLVAAQDGDAALFEAMLAQAMATTDRLERRNLLAALFAFGDPALARRGLGLLLDPRLDIRELMPALSLSHRSIPPRRETHEFIAANFAALEQRVSRDAVARWPDYASRLCTANDRAALLAFWQPRIAKYPGAARNLARAAEAIETCIEVRSGNPRERAPSPEGKRAVFSRTPRQALQ
jgi:alanyl aminopeptidase